MSVTNFSNISSYTQKFNVANISKNIFQYDTPILSSNVLLSNIYNTNNILVLGNTINNNNITINFTSNIYGNISSPNFNSTLYNNSNIRSPTLYINLANTSQDPKIVSNISSTIGNLSVYDTSITGNLNVSNNSNISENVTSTGNIFFNNSLFVLPQVTLSILPIGIIMPLYSSTIPNGWLLCNGQEISRNTYNTLFSLIGTTYGVGDNVSTFNIPNTSERFIIGIDSGNIQGTGFTTLNLTGGANVQTLVSDNLPEHIHDKGTLSIGSHTHTLTFNNSFYFETFQNNNVGRQTGDQLDAYYTNTTSWVPFTDTEVTPITGTIDSTGTSSSFSVLPPHAYLNYIIRAY